MRIDLKIFLTLRLMSLKMRKQMRKAIHLVKVRDTTCWWTSKHVLTMFKVVMHLIVMRKMRKMRKIMMTLKIKKVKIKIKIKVEMEMEMKILKDKVKIKIKKSKQNRTGVKRILTGVKVMRTLKMKVRVNSMMSKHKLNYD